MSSIQQKFVKSQKLRSIHRALPSPKVLHPSTEPDIDRRSDLAVFLSNRFRPGIRVENIVVGDWEGSDDPSKNEQRSFGFRRAGIAVYKWCGDPDATDAVLQTQLVPSSIEDGAGHV
ncbi:hypothetical protein OE766_03520 [Pararhizobium sp. YC-54]|uniref:hypothetical protein n=1 Tax=Pararhizobium sp. YC-54 TaxID=2986920 RepID=UPI0021F6CC99|nr:hypothetical protein [Pararhizobium sp. YC-54]MCV9997307.1 hypothetical protein [Pararhizobium sp. YC-54]